MAGRTSLLIVFLLAASLQSMHGGEPLGEMDASGLVVERRVHPDLSRFRFELEWGESAVESISVVRVESSGYSTGLQRIEVQDVGPYSVAECRERVCFELLDFDFDGDLDMRLLAARGAAGGSESYLVWRFDEQARRYVFDAELSALGPVEIDPVRRRLEVYEPGGFGGAAFDRFFYEFRGGRPVLVEVRRQTLAAEEGQDLKRTIERLVDGNLVTVCEELVRRGAEPERIRGSAEDCR